MNDFFFQILSRLNFNMLRNRQIPEFAIVDGRQNPEVSAFVFQLKNLVARVFLTKKVPSSGQVPQLRQSQSESPKAVMPVWRKQG